jgi:hypothetical protein
MATWFLQINWVQNECRNKHMPATVGLWSIRFIPFPPHFIIKTPCLNPKQFFAALIPTIFIAQKNQQ